MSYGDLNTVFRRAVKRETRPEGRYHTALRLLGGYPNWSQEESTAADAFRRGSTPKDRTARIAGGEIDAAISDPRWMAKKVLGEWGQGEG